MLSTALSSPRPLCCQCCHHADDNRIESSSLSSPPPLFLSLSCKPPSATPPPLCIPLLWYNNNVAQPWNILRDIDPLHPPQKAYPLAWDVVLFDPMHRHPRLDLVWGFRGAFLPAAAMVVNRKITVRKAYFDLSTDSTAREIFQTGHNSDKFWMGGV